MLYFPFPETTSIHDMLDQLADFRCYLYANARSLTNYHLARIGGAV